ncbi:GGDEF domain-containing protein (plasmid) [Rhizobium sp. CB3171]|uniref:sensor domain-containing diguanylate cyclase n=1 Tax=Rhizobium sp. CB3171 TaxID=3039157 RepID=UPI0024B0408D|nr:GGDEF domain-containing protein [Rhizobium sp. CB3171]WFU05966.1 GGDEF domain-containing protein [Rhizobium sp. CB3171]
MHLRELFDRSFKAARIGVWECSLPDQTLSWTNTVYEFFDLIPQTPLARDEIVELYTPESRKLLNEAREKAIRTGEGFTLDAQIVTAKGNSRWIRITACVEFANGSAERIFGVKQDVTAEKTMVEQLRRLADRDILTGLMSRTRFEAFFNEICGGECQRTRSLLLVDLDGFKSVNDTLGHQAGDDCLKVAGRRLSQAVPDADMIARIGGDEFAVIHPCSSAEDLAQIATYIVEGMNWMISTPTKNIQITTSVGAAVIVPGQTPKDIFATADNALYEVKSAGRNGFRIVSLSRPALEIAHGTLHNEGNSFSSRIF